MSHKSTITGNKHYPYFYYFRFYFKLLKSSLSYQHFFKKQTENLRHQCDWSKIDFSVDTLFLLLLKDQWERSEPKPQAARQAYQACLRRVFAPFFPLLLLRTRFSAWPCCIFSLLISTQQPAHDTTSCGKFTVLFISPLWHFFSRKKGFKPLKWHKELICVFKNTLKPLIYHDGFNTASLCSV